MLCLRYQDAGAHGASLAGVEEGRRRTGGVNSALGEMKLIFPVTAAPPSADTCNWPPTCKEARRASGTNTRTLMLPAGKSVTTGRPAGGAVIAAPVGGILKEVACAEGQTVDGSRATRNTPQESGLCIMSSHN